MGRESEPQIGEIDKKINQSHWIRRAIATGEGAILGGVGYLTSTLPMPPDYPPAARFLPFLPLLPLILGGAGATVALKDNEEKLQFSKEKTSEESAK